MGLVEDCSSRSLIYPSALHAHKSILYDIDDSDAVLSTLLVKGKENVCRLHLLSVQGHRYALLEIQCDVFRLIWSINGAYSHFQESLLFILRLVSCILQVKAFMGKVPDVLILGVVGLLVDLKRNIVLLCVFDLFLSALDVPDSPRGDDRHIWSEMLDGKLESYLVVSLSCASVDNCICSFLDCDFTETLCNARAGCAGSKKVFFIYSSCLHGWNDVVLHVVIHQVQGIELGCTGLYGLLLQTFQLICLSYITCNSNDFRIVIVLLEPWNDDGCIETA